MRRNRWFVVAATFLIAGSMPGAHGATRVCLGKTVTIMGTPGDDRLRGTSHRDVISGRGGDDLIFGRGGNDLLCGGDGNDFISGGNGNDQISAGRGIDDDMSGDNGDDVIDGGPGPFDDSRYFTSKHGVTASLVTNTASGQGDDTLLPGVDELLGSPFDDVLTGDDLGQELAGLKGNDVINGGGGDDELAGGRGADTIHGGDGLDLFNPLVEFKVPDGVNVNLATGVASGTGNGNDTLTSIEASFGSPGDDVLVGDDNMNALVVTIDGHDVLSGAGGDDVLDGGDGNDQLDGGPGTDYVGGLDHTAGVNFNLQSGTSTGLGPDADDDTFTGFEDVLGTAFDDVITGDDAANALRGDVGNDQISGLGGNDTLIGDCAGAPGHFFFEPVAQPCPDASPGTNSLDGGSGNDTCLEGSTVANCESTTTPSLRAFGSMWRYRAHLTRELTRLSPLRPVSTGIRGVVVELRRAERL